MLCRSRHECVYPRRQWHCHRLRGAEGASAVTGPCGPRRVLGPRLGLCCRRGLRRLAVMWWVRLLLRSDRVRAWLCCVGLRVLWLAVMRVRRCCCSCRRMLLCLLLLL